MRHNGLLLAMAISCSGPRAPTPPQMTLAASGIVPEWIDRTADPCVDFFAYACGGFTKTERIPPNRAKWGAIPMVEERNAELLRSVLEQAGRAPMTPLDKKIGDFYAACMDERTIEARGLEPVRAELDAIAQIHDAATASDAIAMLHEEGVYAFFTPAAMQDYDDARQIILGLEQSGLGLSDRSYYLGDEASLVEARAAYAAHLERVFGLFGYAQDKARAAAASTMRIEHALAVAQKDVVARRSPRLLYHRVERDGLERVAPELPWRRYLARLRLDGTTTINVDEPSYYAAVAKLVAREPADAIQSYLMAILFDTRAVVLAKAWGDEWFAFHRVLDGSKEPVPRWRRCEQAVDDGLGELLAQPYVAARLPAAAKASATELTKEIFAQMARELDALSWMDAPTRDEAKTKLAKMLYLVGYPDEWQRYEFPVDRSEHARNVAAAARWHLARELAKIAKPLVREWQITPPTVSAYYDPSQNLILIAAGNLQPPFFATSFHPAVNFGSTGGGTIGHEITHGFDDEGSQFDAVGNLRDWWTAPTKHQFEDRTRCVIDQYGRYDALANLKVNGRLTSGENIADNGGVKIGMLAYHAWRARQAAPPPAVVDGYNDDQLYFLGYAQSWCEEVTPQQLEMQVRTNRHAPGKWRVNGVIVNQALFGDAFKCRVGTPMNPPDKCDVW